MPENTKQSVRDSYYDNVRFILMFTVVLCHSLETMRGASVKIACLHEELLSFCMPLFVFLTGFFAKGMVKAGSPKRMRILNIAFLYVIVQLLKMAIAGYTSFLKPVYGNWFLIGMIVWYAVLPLAAKLKPAAVMTCSILAALLIGMDPYANTVLQTSRVVCFFPFFMMGFYLSKEQAEVLKNPKVRLFGVVILIVTAVFCLTVWRYLAPLSMMHASKSYQQMKVSNPEGCVMRLVWYLLATAAGFGVMCIIPREKSKLTVFGTRTLPIFIIHTCLYLFISKKTDFFATIVRISNGYLLLATVLIYTFIVTIVCGNKYFAKAFDWFMGYDFHWLLKKEKE